MSVRILVGHCNERMAELPDGSVHTAIFSPPYFGLRDYGTALWEGGDPDCDHKVGELRTGAGMAKFSERYRGGVHKAAIVKPMTAKSLCPHCGAVRVDKQIGLEETPAEYIAKMVDVMRGVWRVLRDDGTVWLNIGDSYANDGKWGGETGGKQAYLDEGSRKRVGREKRRTGLKPKDLIGIPWRLAFALQDDGWWLRQDIVWVKPNPMPESVTDRCTKAHEYIFLLSKSEDYYFDQDAILEEASPNTHARLAQDVQRQIGSERAHAGKPNGSMKAVGRGAGRGLTPRHQPHSSSCDQSGLDVMPNIVRRRDVETTARPPHSRPHSLSAYESRKIAAAASGIKNNTSMDEALAIMPLERNKRSVWTVATQPFTEAHFAVFPPALIEPCVLAGTSAHGCCPTCGAPWERITARVETGQVQKMPSGMATHEGRHGTIHKDGREPDAVTDNPVVERVTQGWYPTCRCAALEPLPAYPPRPGRRPSKLLALCAMIADDAYGCAEDLWREHCQWVTRVRTEGCERAAPLPVVRATVLDPFGGAGTTGLVSDRHGRDAILVELNPTYAEMARKRLIADAPLFAEVISEPDPV